MSCDFETTNIISQQKSVTQADIGVSFGNRFVFFLVGFKKKPALVLPTRLELPGSPEAGKMALPRLTEHPKTAWLQK